MAFHLSGLKRSGHCEPGQSPSSYLVTVPHSVQLRRCPKPILSHTPDRLGHAVPGDNYWAHGPQSPCWIFVSASLAASAKEPVQCHLSIQDPSPPAALRIRRASICSSSPVQYRVDTEPSRYVRKGLGVTRGRLRVLHHYYSRHPGRQRGNCPAQQGSGQAPSLSPSRRDSTTGAPRSAERGVPPQHPSDWLSRELHTSR